jgi:hypothetical protein
MSSPHHSLTHPPTVLIIWLAGFAVIGFIAACIFFNLVRDLVRNWRRPPDLFCFQRRT